MSDGREAQEEVDIRVTMADPCGVWLATNTIL